MADEVNNALILLVLLMSEGTNADLDGIQVRSRLGTCNGEVLELVEVFHAVDNC